MATRKPAKKQSAKRPARTTAVDPVTDYARKVISGKIRAGPHVRNACKRHISDRKRKDLHFDTAAAERIIGFFHDLLRLSDGQFEGNPFTLDISQKFIVGSIFGWKKQPAGRRKTPREQWKRRFRRAYIEIAKGNGKSPLLAGIGLYGMLADGEASAEVYSAAATKDQARILFNDAVKMVGKSEHLSQIVIRSGQNPVWQLSHLPSASFFKPISKETKRTGSGPRPHMALIDELHEHPDKGIVEVLERGFKFREQPLIVMATNSGVDFTSVCGEEHQHGVGVVDGTIKDDESFAYICAVDKGENPRTKRSCWIKTNPLLNKIIQPELLKNALHQANVFPSRLNGILRLHFCEWTQSETAWIAREKWEACEDEKLKLEDFIGNPCFAGLDLSSTTDLTALAILFEDGFNKRGQQKWAAFVRAWMPSDRVQERSERDRVPYDQWQREKWLTVSDGARIRMEDIAGDVIKLHEKSEIKNLAYDRYLYDQFEDKMIDLGGNLPTIEHGQGYTRRKGSPLWMPLSIDELETAITEKRIRFQQNPLLRFAVAGAKLRESPAGLRRWEKAKSTTRIDCLVALTMAMGAATGGEVNKLVNFYNQDIEETVR